MVREVVFIHHILNRMGKGADQIKATSSICYKLTPIVPKLDVSVEDCTH